MARIAGIEVPNNKRVHVALRYVHGVGPALAVKVVQQAGIQGNPKLGELKEEEVNRIREIIDKNYKVEADLRRENQLNVRRLIEIRSFRGLRHVKGLPVRGQRTRTNARTKRGSRKTVAGRRKAVAKK
ncbi:MAG: 30S ribosomal protein S13 [Chloroflexi bacterium]|nr:30S ribosomal protein S13 [Chloroflexota bacterium]MBI4201412.1 30S ribosomal protein S13 [Chloroflexota bacterium]